MRKAHEHLVPITAAIQEVIGSLPRIKGGKYLFSLSGGKRPLSMTGPIKADLDGRMLRTLKAMARRRGEDHEHVTLPAWSQPRSAPDDPQRDVEPFASRPMSPKPFSRTVRAASPPPMTCMSIRRRGRSAGAMGGADRDNRQPEPAAPAKIIKMRKRRR